jgi:hypothetical protein
MVPSMRMRIPSDGLFFLLRCAMCLFYEYIRFIERRVARGTVEPVKFDTK